MDNCILVKAYYLHNKTAIWTLSKPAVKLRDLFVRHAKITVVVVVVVVVARVYAYHPFTATTIFRDLQTFRR